MSKWTLVFLAGVAWLAWRWHRASQAPATATDAEPIQPVETDDIPLVERLVQQVNIGTVGHQITFKQPESKAQAWQWTGAEMSGTTTGGISTGDSMPWRLAPNGWLLASGDFTTVAPTAYVATVADTTKNGKLEGVITRAYDIPAKWRKVALTAVQMESLPRCYGWFLTPHSAAAAQLQRNLSTSRPEKNGWKR